MKFMVQQGGLTCATVALCNCAAALGMPYPEYGTPGWDELIREVGCTQGVEPGGEDRVAFCLGLRRVEIPFTELPHRCPATLVIHNPGFMNGTVKHTVCILASHWQWMLLVGYHWAHRSLEWVEITETDIPGPAQARTCFAVEPL